MAEVETSSAAGADPTNELESTATKIESGVFSESFDRKVEWNDLVKTQLNLLSTNLESSIEKLEEFQARSTYTELIEAVSQDRPIEPSIGSLRDELSSAQLEVFFEQKIRVYFMYFVKLIQAKLERSPNIKETDFDKVFRLNADIQQELVTPAGEFVNPLTQVVMTKAEYNKHIRKLDDIRAVAKDKIWAKRDTYKDYVLASGKNFPNNRA